MAQAKGSLTVKSENKGKRSPKKALPPKVVFEQPVKDSAKDSIPVQTEVLIRSKKFANYQQDFMRALLPNGAYTVAQAEEILTNYFKEKGV